MATYAISSSGDRARVIDALSQGPLSLSELSRTLGYKSIPKRLSVAVDELVAEGVLVRITTGGARTKLAVVRG